MAQAGSMGHGNRFAMGRTGRAVRFKANQSGICLDSWLVSTQDFRCFTVEADGDIGRQFRVLLLQPGRFPANIIIMSQVVMVLLL